MESKAVGKRHLGRRRPKQLSEEAEGVGHIFGLKVMQCPGLDRLNPVVTGSPSSVSPEPPPAPSHQEVGARRVFPTGTCCGNLNALIWGGAYTPHLSHADTSLPTKKLVRPPTPISKAQPQEPLCLASGEWLKLTAFHIFVRELAVRPKLGVR